jgi:hypothetical protein
VAGGDTSCHGQPTGSAHSERVDSCHRIGVAVLIADSRVGSWIWGQELPDAGRVLSGRQIVGCSIDQGTEVFPGVGWSFARADGSSLKAERKAKYGHSDRRGQEYVSGRWCPLP